MSDSRQMIMELGSAAQGAEKGKGLSIEERKIMAALAIAAALCYVGDVLDKRYE